MTEVAAVGYEDLLREAAEWRLMGLLFEYPREGWREELAALVSQVSDPALREAGQEARGDGHAGLYLAVLGPGGAVSPREVGYLPLQDPGRILADVTAFYEAFGYQPALTEPLDHVAAEAGFLGYLKLKEAFARSRDATEEAAVAAEAAESFLAEHLRNVAEPLSRRLATAAPRYLVLAGEALLRRARPSSGGNAAIPACSSSAACATACGPVDPDMCREETIMKATDVLMTEHRVIERVLTSLEAAADRLAQGQSVRPGFFLDAADFIKNFADGCHYHKEEGVLFEAMVAAGMPRHAGPIAVMLSEHEQGRAFTRGMREAAERLESGDGSAAGQVVQSAHGYVDLLRQHIVKEDNILFPMAGQALPVAEQDRVWAAFEHVEHADTGEGVHEKYETLAERLEEEAGR